MEKPTSVFQNAFVLTGPTGSGKSRAAVDLAREVGGEIVSMDSMAIYRGMDIGTAKPTDAERQGVPHHLLDVLDPWQPSSVAWWLAEAERVCCDIQARGRKVLIVGGTPLYLKAILFGLFEGPPADPDLRATLEAEERDRGPGWLHRRLEESDPETAHRLHPNDVRRIVRALEVQQLTGRRMSDAQREWGRPPVATPACVWVDLPREELYARIDARVERMFADGLVAEVERLLQLPRPPGREARQALGYKEVIGYLEGERALAGTVRQVQTRTRQFAKRQITWFRHLPGCEPVSGELTRAVWDSRMKE